MAVDGGQNSRQSDLAVMDAQEYKQKRRLERILDARDKVEEMSERAYGQYVEGHITEDGKNIRILRAVQEYIREVYNLIREYESELEGGARNEYWSGEEGGEPLGRIEFESRQPLVFWGLSDVLHARDFYTEEWEEQKQCRHGPDQSETWTATYTVSEKVSMNAFLLVNQFLCEVKGLEIQFEEMENHLPTWGFEEIHDEEIKGTEELADVDRS